MCTLLQIGCGGLNPSSDGSSPGPITGDLTDGGIKGTVYATGTVPVVGALVEGHDRQTTTDAAGAYLLTPVPPGDYRITARAQGFEPTIRDGVRVFPGMITENIDFTLSSAAASASADFAVLQVLPKFGTDGDVISVIGTGFGKTPGRVSFAGKDAAVLSWNQNSDGVVRVQLPAEVETGPVKVYINGEESHESQDVTFIAAPVALSVTPPSGKAGTKVSLIGRNFNPIAAFNKVSLNGRACQVLSAPTTRQLEIILPTPAETGILQIRIESNEYQLDGTSQALITVPPELVHMSPKRSIPGITITVYGYNFGTNKDAVKVWIGEQRTLTGNQFSLINTNKLSFAAPGTDIIEPGKSYEVRVAVNDIKSNAITYTAYNPAWTTLSDYGVHEFSAVSSGGTLHLPSLRSGDRIAFISVLSGNGSIDLGGNYSYFCSAWLGNNRSAVPSPLPGGSIRTDSLVQGMGPEPLALSPSPGAQLGRLVRSWKGTSRVSAPPESVRSAFPDPLPATTTFWLVDFASADPQNAANDVLASGTLTATGTRCAIYLDDAPDTVLLASETEEIAAWFDGIYNTLATACSDGISIPPEGNIDGQKRIVLFLTPQITRGVSAANAGLGYFHPRDKQPAQVHSAGTEILYFSDAAFRDSPGKARAAMAQELQQMMYFNQKGLLGSTWIDEGLGLFAQQIVGEGFAQGKEDAVSQVAAYLRQPHLVSLSHFPDQPGPENFGMSYLFVQYLFERCSGYAAIRSLERNNGFTGFLDIENDLLTDAAITEPDSNGIEYFFQEFCLALYCDNIGLPVSYFPAGRAAAYEFAGLDLRNAFSGVIGLRHLTFNENPANRLNLGIKGYGCDVVEYVGGNGGDLEVTISYPTGDGIFKTWVVYYTDSN